MPKVSGLEHSRKEGTGRKEIGLFEEQRASMVRRERTSEEGQGARVRLGTSQSWRTPVVLRAWRLTFRVMRRH